MVWDFAGNFKHENIRAAENVLFAWATVRSSCCTKEEISTSFLCYLYRTSSLPSSDFLPSLMLEALREASMRVVGLLGETDEASLAPKHTKKSYSSSSIEDRA